TKDTDNFLQHSGFAVMQRVYASSISRPDPGLTRRYRKSDRRRRATRRRRALLAQLRRLGVAALGLPRCGERIDGPFDQCW
ncbi:MAG: hypothetical protein M5R40_29420, partial [Anaerolineae bacterium]|nr:hypothetical protein [Anaerolineae bacterium]